MTGDAVVVMMADESDDCRDVVRYWTLLNEGWECVFGSRFMPGGGVVDYPRVKLLLNRLANLFIRALFRVPLNDTTNAFKAYRRSVIDGCRPIIAPHFNLTVELPLKAIVRVLVDRHADYLAQPADGGSQAQDQGDGQPIPVHHLLCLAGEVLQPWRLSSNRGPGRPHCPRRGRTRCE
jgi:hypothetical protein